ncbi:hypothetical protein C1645_821189 [Glomus cerebriforme]|uniref:Uncharacterized protein n=1 Tax=Glomus cerebriforme TaxID=658196 RepID=A0A397T1B2_9GLOM|nr:hypothetical protein C1645_821189 [Glomus cerebriforme]
MIFVTDVLIWFTKNVFNTGSAFHSRNKNEAILGSLIVYLILQYLANAVTGHAIYVPGEVYLKVSVNQRLLRRDLKPVDDRPLGMKVDSFFESSGEKDLELCMIELSEGLLVQIWGGLDDSIRVLEQLKKSHRKNSALCSQNSSLKKHIGDAKNSPQKPKEKNSRIISLLMIHDDDYNYSDYEEPPSSSPSNWKILEENPKILSKNGYIIIYEKLYENDKVHGFPTNYIYCSVCDFLVFIPGTFYSARRYHDSHLKRCISGNTISNEHARRNEILKSIDTREFQIWQYKQYILQEEAKINHLHLELFSQSTSHSEKDKLVSISYNHDGNFTASYKNYAQSKTTIAKNTMPSTPKFESACNSNAKQKMVSPISHYVLNQKSEVLNGPTPPPLP